MASNSINCIPPNANQLPLNVQTIPLTGQIPTTSPNQFIPAVPPSGVCPHCGYCPHCGRSNCHPQPNIYWYNSTGNHIEDAITTG